MATPKIKLRQFDAGGAVAGIALGFDPEAITALREHKRVFIGLPPEAGRCPLAIADGAWFDAHPDTGFMSPGPRYDLTAADLDDLNAGRSVRRRVEGTVLFPEIELLLVLAGDEATDWLEFELAM